jgi:hypothetical protein
MSLTPHRLLQLPLLDPPRQLLPSALMLPNNRSTRGMVLRPPSTIDKGLVTRLPFDKPLRTTMPLYHPLLLPRSITMLRVTRCGHYPHPFIRTILLQFPIILMDVSAFSHLVPADFFSRRSLGFIPFSHWTLCSPSSPSMGSSEYIFILQFFRTLCSPSLYGFSRTLFIPYSDTMQSWILCNPPFIVSFAILCNREDRWIGLR